ncbi:D-serine deaminase-like pyridoxal phosphate-dependent protein [Stackebrandtia albiflava]|uniref:D-serine deaminase-like pyridoxal phosphate-dependent protein n=1 Tax=Stackebrandtia albiflava TaxID=406432 RepID=A0A562VAW8_9ACTN|nr:alanine racemase [Stackebrandtia albiflava]TWJ15026.1 D-serine deaminase-like pyridoxal phosphate-dependent protein [Stackebrandtia albiflava]
MLADAVDRIYDERSGWWHKAVPDSGSASTIREWLAGRPTLDSLATPVMTLDESALAHNVAAMADWCRDAGLGHMPHGKTTMAPQLWLRQLSAGAEGITLANAPQLRVARAFGVPRVLLANELVHPVHLAWLADWLTEGGDVTCLVDSHEGVARADEAMRERGVRLPVCVELGAPGARGGVRDVETALELAEAVRRAPGLRLAGVGGYEGSLAHDDAPESIAAVDRFLGDLARLHRAIDWPDVPVVTAGGSEYFDQVAAALAPLAEEGAHVVLRAGSYITHDDGLYAGMTPAARSRSGPDLRAALRVYGTVVSMPEPGLALLDVGRRDVSFDAGMPIALDHPDAAVVDLNDQHAHLRGDVAALSVGDVVRLGISHPCTAFDKWSLIPVVDAGGAVVDVVRTYF